MVSSMIEKEILYYYNSGKETDRLFVGRSQLERVRTQEIILRYLHKTPSKILDVGGATGFYSFWLNNLGHEVHLVDPVPLYIQEAENISKKSERKLASISAGEVRDLEFASDYFDVALLLGPMYHLTEREERLSALAETRRVLIQGGLLFCVGISRYASMLDGYFGNLIKDPRFVEIMNRDLKDGQHRNPDRIKGYFTTAYLHRPEELKKEITEVGFKLEALIAVDSFGGFLSDFDEKWKDDDYRELLLRTIRATESDTSILGMGGHSMAIASK